LTIFCNALAKIQRESIKGDTIILLPTLFALGLCWPVFHCLNCEKLAEEVELFDGRSPTKVVM